MIKIHGNEIEELLEKWLINMEKNEKKSHGEEEKLFVNRVT